MMTIKRVIKIAAAAAVICLITVLSGCAPTKTEPGQDLQYTVNLPVERWLTRFDIELSVKLLDFPETVPVYKFIQPNITEKYVKSLGKQFGLNGSITCDDDVIAIDDDDTDGYLKVYKATGTIIYTNNVKRYPPKPSNLPSNEEAINIATNFLKRIKTLPKGWAASRVIARKASG